MNPTKAELNELVVCLKDALRVLDLPACEISREEGETAASYSYKCGYARGAIRNALDTLRVDTKEHA